LIHDSPAYMCDLNLIVLRENYTVTFSFMDLRPAFKKGVLLFSKNVYCCSYESLKT